MILPLLAIAYLGVGFVRTQKKTVASVIHPTLTAGFTNEPLWHAAVWPAGFFVAGK
jgi:hypothetical protein